MAAFEKRVTIRFAHTDAAGIAFYPRYFGLINDFVEDWFGEGLGFSFRHLHIDEKRAVPTVHIEADFLAPSRMHDTLVFRLAVTKIGTSSCHLKVTGTAADGPRFHVRLIIVQMDMATGKSLPWPDDLRAAMLPWCGAEPEGASP